MNMRPKSEDEKLYHDVVELPGVGPTFASALRKINLETIDDVLHHFPVRYDDRSQIRSISSLQDGEYVTVRGKVQQLRGRRAFRRRAMFVVEGLVADDTGSVRVVWFQQPFITKTLGVGDEIFLTGKVSGDSFGVQMSSPVYEKVLPDNSADIQSRVIPIYGLTEGVSQKQFRTIVKGALDLVGFVPDWIPDEIRSEWNFVTYDAALRTVHFPESVTVSEEARQRFRFDRALLQQLNQQIVKRYNASVPGCALPLDVGVVKEFISSLPFSLTEDQRKAAYAILKDMEAAHPMNRLLQGDVGSGKTIVAAIAMRHAAAHGCTSILLAPTQILAEQHVKTLERVFSGTDIPIILMTAATKKKVALPKGPCVVVGTHALLHDKVQYPQLGLVVVDEQHRFGVAQRKAIKDKNKAGYTPHFLSMTATPIPRSLSLVLFGSLAVSIIRQMPAGRKAIQTKIVAETDRSKAEKFVRAHVAQGEQVFVVAPLIDPSDVLSVESATALYDRLKKETFPDLRIGLVHGKIKPKERAVIMEAMRRGEIDILVATAVIEVGVDIPNATIMWIEGADRFGLAQLHQFRGRVGRGDKQSYCFLFSKSGGKTSRDRLELMEQTTDGFVLAEKDLEMRGAGEMWGVVQSGFAEVEFLRSIDIDVWDMAERAATKIFEKGFHESHPLLAKQIDRFESELHRE